MGIWELSAGQLIASGGPIMIPILLCSFVALGIVIEKFFYYASIRTDVPRLKSNVFNCLKNNKIKESLQICDSNPSPVAKILKAENITFENKLLIKIAKKCYPDVRKTIQALQANSLDGKLTDTKILTAEEIFEKILNLMLERDLEKIRAILRSNYIDYVSLYEYLFQNFKKFASPGGAILEIGNHIRLDNEVPNKEINFIHMVVIMMLQNVIK